MSRISLSRKDALLVVDILERSGATIVREPLARLRSALSPKPKRAAAAKEKRAKVAKAERELDALALSRESAEVGRGGR